MISLSPINPQPFPNMTVNGVIFATATVLTLVMACLYARRSKAALVRHVIGPAPWAMLAGFFAARFTYTALCDALFLDPAEKLYFYDGGYSLHGAFLGVAAAVAVYYLIKKSPDCILQVLDCAFFGAPLGIALGRIGNWVNQECYGTYVENPVFCRFPFAVYIKAHDGWHLALFFWESVACIIIFLAMLAVNQRHRGAAGAMTVTFLVLYSGFRAVIENLRADSIYIGFVRIPQVLSGVILLAAFVLLAVKLRRQYRPWYIGLYLGFLTALGAGFAAEFYMSRTTHVRNTVILFVCCMVMALLDMYMYLRLLRMQGRGQPVSERGYSPRHARGC